MTKINYQVKCGTCQRVIHMHSLPAVPDGWFVECDRCHGGTLKQPKRSVRHCWMCREPIIVVGVPGGVRLTCGKCLMKDPSLIEVEKVLRERDAVQKKLDDAVQANAKVTRELGEMRDHFDDAVEVRAAEVAEDLRLEQQEAVERAEGELAERIRSKLQKKYGAHDNDRA